MLKSISASTTLRFIWDSASAIFAAKVDLPSSSRAPNTRSVFSPFFSISFIRRIARLRTSSEYPAETEGSVMRIPDFLLKSFPSLGIAARSSVPSLGATSMLLRTVYLADERQLKIVQIAKNASIPTAIAIFPGRAFIGVSKILGSSTTVITTPPISSFPDSERLLITASSSNRETSGEPDVT